MSTFTSRNGTLARDTSVTAWGTPITVPAGTRVRTAEQGTGLGYFWAVADVPLLIQLTGNSHDPVYRWCEVPADAVTPN
jgi:hypothetical protein